MCFIFPCRSKGPRRRGRTFSPRLVLIGSSLRCFKSFFVFFLVSLAHKLAFQQKPKEGSISGFSRANHVPQESPAEAVCRKSMLLVGATHRTSSSSSFFSSSSSRRHQNFCQIMVLGSAFATVFDVGVSGGWGGGNGNFKAIAGYFDSVASQFYFIDLMLACLRAFPPRLTIAKIPTAAFEGRRSEMELVPHHGIRLAAAAAATTSKKKQQTHANAHKHVRVRLDDSPPPLLSLPSFHSSWAWPSP